MRINLPQYRVADAHFAAEILGNFDDPAEVGLSDPVKQFTQADKGENK